MAELCAWLGRCACLLNCCDILTFDPLPLNMPCITTALSTASHAPQGCITDTSYINASRNVMDADGVGSIRYAEGACDSCCDISVSRCPACCLP